MITNNEKKSASRATITAVVGQQRRSLLSMLG
jgi:hypothetical protein